MTLNKMEQKTAEEILRENGVTVDGENITQGYYNAVVYAMKLFTDQEVSKAIEKALEVASDNGCVMRSLEIPKQRHIKKDDWCYFINKQSILSLKPEILKELEK